jgi:hypothetical protein
MKLFNPDMDRRLSDLQAALEAEADITVSSVGAMGNLPARVEVRTGPRVLIFDRPMAEAVGAQLIANGYGIGDELKAAARG